MLHSISYSASGETYRWFRARLDAGVLKVPEHGIELTAAGSRSERGT
jgi:CRISPR-associated protein Cas5d